MSVDEPGGRANHVADTRLHNFRQLVIRYEYKAENFLGFVQHGSMIIIMRTYF